jgi:hypothetical protein
MNPLSGWMRRTLAATTVYNAFGVLIFIPLTSVGRDQRTEIRGQRTEVGVRSEISGC